MSLRRTVHVDGVDLRAHQGGQPWPKQPAEPGELAMCVCQLCSRRTFSQPERAAKAGTVSVAVAESLTIGNGIGLYPILDLASGHA